MRAGRRLGAVTAALAAVSVGLAACSNASASGGGSGAPGVTAHSISVGALATESGPLSSGFAEVVDGVRAYFDMVNAQGGVAGRKLDLAHVADDTGSATVDTEQARTLVSADHVFAIVGVATPFFSAASYLAQTGTPTFGEVISSGWADHPNLFGTFGSVLAYSTNGPAVAWMAKQVGATTAAVVAYNGVAQSQDACRADASALQRAGISVPVADYSYALGGNPDGDVFRMYADHVQLLVSCLAGPDNLKFAQVMKQYHLANADALWLDGYSRQTVAQYPAATNNTYFLFQHVPFEAANAYASRYPGMVRYVETMNRYAPRWTYDETAFEGWVAAAQFVAGLRAVGHGTLTQKTLIDAINRETAFTAGGVMPPISWRTAHDKAVPPYCVGFAYAHQGQTVVALLRPPGQVLTCFNPTNPTPVTPPRGTPGAPTGKGGSAGGTGG